MEPTTLGEWADAAGLELCRRPIFIVGSPRSGTTALASGLSRHGELWTSDESFFLHSLFGGGKVVELHERMYNRKAPSWLRTEDVGRAEFLGFLGLGINALYSSRSGGRRWMDQTPLYTRMVFELAELFPTAQFLHIVRDGRKVVASMSAFLNKFTDRPEAVQYVPGWAYDFREACETWRDWVSTAESFRAQHPQRCFQVRNERLLSDADEHCREIFRFLELAEEPGPAEYFRTTTTNSSFASGGHRPADDDGWQGWEEADRAAFLEIAGDLMVSLGYLEPSASGDALAPPVPVQRG